jgi:YHS domain-containing protein
VVRLLLLFLLAMFLARAFWRLLAGVAEGAIGVGSSGAQPRPAARVQTPPVKMVKDPVCGTFVVPGKSLELVRAGETQWFCSERCRAAFAKRGPA